MPHDYETRQFVNRLTAERRKGSRGHLIVFEGLDRSGKSTQCEKLVSNLETAGKRVKHIRFPARETPIGHVINDYLSRNVQQEDHAMHLLFSANRWELVQNIERLINSGTTIVIDRYYYSGCAYSAAKQDPTMDLAWCRQPEVGLPRPDICLFLDLSPEEAAKRGGFGEERYEKAEMQARVRESFAEMRQHDDEAEDIVVINAAGSVEEVEARIAKAIEERLQEIDRREENGLRSVRPW